MAEMGEISKFMAEIIRLLTDLVGQVKRNEDLLRETQGILKNNQMMIEQLSQNAGMQNIAAASESLETAITMLQKGVQTMQIHSTLRQVQDFLGAMGSSVSSSGSGVKVVAAQGGQAAPAQGGQAQKSGEEQHLIKPSDLFG